MLRRFLTPISLFTKRHRVLYSTSYNSGSSFVNDATVGTLVTASVDHIRIKIFYEW